MNEKTRSGNLLPEEEIKRAVNLLQKAPDPYLILTPDYVIRYANDAYLEATLAHQRDIIGMNVFDAFPDNPKLPRASGVANLKASLDKVITTKKIDRLPLQHYDVPRQINHQEEGFEEKYWNVVNVPVLNDKQEVDYIIHRAMDVTDVVKKEGKLKNLTKETEILSSALNELKKQAVELEINKNLLEAIFNSSSYSIAIFKTIYGEDKHIEDFECLMANQLTAVKTGINSNEIIGRRYTELFPEAVQAGLINEFKKVMTTGVTSMFEKKYDTAGTAKWFYFTASRVKDFLVVSTEDISRRKVEEEEILKAKDAQTQQATDRYQSLFNSMDEGFCILEIIFDEKQNPVDCKYIDVNSVFEKLTGIGNPLGRTIKEILPDLEALWLQAYGKVALTGESVKFENYANSVEKWFDVNAFRIGNPENKQVAVLFSDITERKKIEQALKENQERQSFLLKLNDELRDVSNPFDIQKNTCDLLGKYFKVNRVVYCENHGEEFVIQYDYIDNLPSMKGRYPVEVFGPEKFMEYFNKGEAFVVNDVVSDDRLDSHEKEAYLSAKMVSFIGIGLVKKGILRASFGIHSSSPRKWSEREIELSKSVAERTWAAVDKARTEEALKESEMRFRTMAEASGIFISHSDTLGKAIYFNEEWMRITGLTMDELMNYQWIDLLHPEDKDSYMEAYLDAVERRQSLKWEFRLQRFDGNYRWLLAVVSPRFSVNGNYAGHISSCIDITDQKNAEQALDIKNRELIKINNDLDNFIYTASHDLKAPISNIEGLMNTLVKNLPKEVHEKPLIEKVISMIDLSVKRFKNTILDLTEIARLQKQFGENVQNINLIELIEDIKFDLQNYIEQTNAEILVNVEECKTVNFSEKNLRSIFYNLISNALKYHSPFRAPKIEVRCANENNFKVIIVKDNGLGLDPSQHEKIFSMFKRVHSHVEGSGVGLYIVKKIVENAGGRIEVESEVDKGSTFKVYLNAE